MQLTNRLCPFCLPISATRGEMATGPPIPCLSARRLLPPPSTFHQRCRQRIKNDTSGSCEKFMVAARTALEGTQRECVPVWAEQQCCAPCTGEHHHHGQGRLQLLEGRQPLAMTDRSRQPAWCMVAGTVVLGDTEAAEESPLGRRKARKGGLREDERGRRGSCARHSCCWWQILIMCWPTVWLRRSCLLDGSQRRVQGREAPGFCGTLKTQLLLVSAFLFLFRG